MGLTPTSELTSRDRRILEILALRVRVLSVAQLARTFWSDAEHPHQAAIRRLVTLEAGGWIERLVILAHPEIELAAPVITWRPGEPLPEFGRVAYQLKSRWTQPPQETAVAIASKSAGTWLGGRGGRPPRRSEATHDLHLGTVFLRLMRDQPARAARWVSEASLQSVGRGRNEKLPDALLRLRAGTTAIELGGAYSKTKLSEFHAHCVREKYAYEIW